MLGSKDRELNKRFLKLCLLKKQYGPMKITAHNKARLNAFLRTAFKEQKNYDKTDKKNLKNVFHTKVNTFITWDNDKIFQVLDCIIADIYPKKLNKGQKNQLKQICDWADKNDILFANITTETTNDDFILFDPSLDQSILAEILSDKSLSSEQFFSKIKKAYLSSRIEIFESSSISAELVNNLDISFTSTWGTEFDLMQVLRGIATDPENITCSGSYILTPMQNTPEAISNIVKKAIDSLRQKQQSNDKDNSIELLIPVSKNNAHWVLGRVVIQNLNIVEVEHSDSCGNTRERSKQRKNSEYKSCLEGWLSGKTLGEENFAETFIDKVTNRDEQNNGYSCMDYTLRHALRLAGKNLINPDTGKDFFELSYSFGCKEKACDLRKGIIDILKRKINDEKVECRTILDDEKKVLSDEWNSVLLKEQSVEKESEDQGIKVQEDDSATVISQKLSEDTRLLTSVVQTESAKNKQSKIISGLTVILKAIFFVIILPYTILKATFDLGKKIGNSVVDAFSHPKVLEQGTVAPAPVVGDCRGLPMGLAASHPGAGMALVRNDDKHCREISAGNNITAELKRSPRP